MQFEPPIQNLDAIDILGERNDGGIDLAIVCSGPLDDSADTLRRVSEKIGGYLTEIQSQQFQMRFGSPGRARTRVIVYCQHPISSGAQGLINVLSKRAAESGIEIAVDSSAV
jgi:hypothetical protein